MAWTAPKTWASEPLTSNDLNSYIRDNQNFLKNRVDGSAAAQASGTGTYSTTSASYVDVDATNLAPQITTQGGDVMITVVMNGYNSGTSRPCIIAIDIDSGAQTIVGPASPYIAVTPTNLSFTAIVSGLAAGDHTFKLQFATTGAGTSYVQDVEMDVREITQVAA